MTDRSLRMNGPRAADRNAEIERLLRDRASIPLAPPPAQLRGRIMDGLRESPAAPGPALVIWPWAAAAAACAALVLSLTFLTRPAPVPPAPQPGAPALTSTVPLAPSGMIRMVAGPVDRPLLDQADRMMSDTRRATRAVVRLVPFAGRGG